MLRQKYYSGRFEKCGIENACRRDCEAFERQRRQGSVPCDRVDTDGEICCQALVHLQSLRRNTIRLPRPRLVREAQPPPGAAREQG